jgi:hypothetical protein
VTLKGVFQGSSTAKGATNGISGGCGIRHYPDQPPDRMGLSDTAFGQWRIEATLDSPFQVPFGLAMANQQYATGHDTPTLGLRSR